MKKTLFLFSLTILFATNSFAQSMHRESLRGLSSIPVKVEVSYLAGMSEAMIQEFVELRLRSAGIHVPEDHKPLSREGSALLLITVISTDSEDISAIEMKLKQAVTLARKPTVEMSLATWEARQWGGESKDNSKYIKDALGSFLDAFIKDYLAVNSK